MTLATLVVSFESSAAAEEWLAEAEPQPRLVTPLPRLSFWKGTFDRPSRACLLSGCPADASVETGVGLGAELRIHIVSAFYALCGFELVRSWAVSQVSDAFIAPIELGFGVTFWRWPVRPIFEVALAPMLYLTDDARDFTVVGRVGLEAELPGVATLGLTSALHSSQTFDGFQISMMVGPPQFDH